jgi:AcrR family transcriptional regulator
MLVRVLIEECHVEPVSGDAALQLLGRAFGDDAAAVHNSNHVGELIGLFEVLRGQEHRPAAAKRCLYEKGYANTTARDIATAAGTSLAAIGYHYRSTEALLNAAMIEAMAEWGDHIAATLAEDASHGSAAGDEADPLAHFERFWSRVLESFEGKRRVWAASFELFALVDRVPEVRQQLADANEEARLGLGATFGGLDPATDLARTRAVGSFYQALLSGVIASGSSTRSGRRGPQTSPRDCESSQL